MGEQEEKTYIPARARAVSVNFFCLKLSMRSVEAKGRQVQAPREKPKWMVNIHKLLPGARRPHRRGISCRQPHLFHNISVF